MTTKRHFFPHNYYNYPMTPSDALRELIELRDDVANGFHIPKRFRNKPFTNVQRDRFVYGIEREIEKVKAKISNYN